jgi:hypothetical protein
MTDEEVNSDTRSDEIMSMEDRSRREGILAMRAMDEWESRYPNGYSRPSTPAASEVGVVATRPKSAAKAKAWASGSTRSATQPEIFHMEGDYEITEEERQILAKRREKMKATAEKQKQSKALTGSQANYPSLSHTWSKDVGLNIAGSVRARMVVFAWKRFLWMLRAKTAVERTFRDATWKRNRRWLASLLATETGSLFGHFGSMRQQLRNPEMQTLM